MLEPKTIINYIVGGFITFTIWWMFAGDRIESGAIAFIFGVCTTHAITSLVTYLSTRPPKNRY